ncbi:Uroporphyrinogen-III methyltransferase [Candidatus Syntrophocurvum alkaliphilum]|uniref:uroporphyrinogen-III C-methyltransferase n=1 Tax=Candidatus Syntrophocurvum alkaliphilum TaxID=2293317 RepID=A0A6I6DE60_9FIRM|nr:uroporphyrinogen-III C-methyltransferase [Candidatus Syntrophocurvum alkaliphilum]QGT99052.1 Uroporphyrinogen-III methyltransferase [Candidatus Syntrophocurvum alkaliphilum]
MNKKGYVYLVGAGPGDPGLFTLKGKSLLSKAEVVVYDRLVSKTILSYINPDAEVYYVGKASGNHALSQDEINELLLSKAQQGKMVVRLKGGDPYLFGRGGEEALYLKDHGINSEVVPGITSAIAVPAYAGIPVTHRELTSSFAVITGHEKPGKTESSIQWEKISTGIGTLVFLMGIENLSFIVKNLLENGREKTTPVALIRWGTNPEQEVIISTLEKVEKDVYETNFKSPAIIVVGEVVNLRDKLKWIEDKPLWGTKIVVTRARAQASLLTEKIQMLGGQPIEFPSIEIKKEENLYPLYNAFQTMENYDWLIFTSVNAVKIFFEELMEQNYDIRSLNNINICAIGPVTRDSLRDKGLKVDVVPDEYKAEGIIEELRTKIKPGQSVLLPRARGARSILPETIREWDVYVNEVYLYEAVTTSNISEEQIKDILEGNVDYITFTSSSTVTNFVNIIGKDNIDKINSSIKIACIGPITAGTAKENNFSVDTVADRYTIDGLIEAILIDRG